MSKRKTTEQFIQQASLIHNGLYDYSKVNYIDSKTKVIIIDPVYGEFEQRPDHHLGGQVNLKKFKVENKIDNKQKFIEKARKVHGDLYDYSKVNYINARKKVIIIDPVYGEFEQMPHSHLAGAGCNIRNGGAKLSINQFIEKARKVHGDLYDYSKVNYINNKTKVIIIDPIYGEFEQTPSGHLSGKGNCNRNLKCIYEKDHIIPLSIICSSNERFDLFVKNRPLFKILNSDKNIQIITNQVNRKKSDTILIDNSYIKARYYRNNYNVIKKLLLYHNMFSETEIDNIIKKDIIYMSKEKSNSL